MTRPELGSGYRIILADPPWAYDVGGVQGAADDQYETATVADICRIVDVGAISARDSLLYCWTTQVGLAEGWHLELFDAWGFTPITLPFVWMKTNADGYTPKMGLGFYTRSQTEFLVLGKKGKGVKRMDASVPQVLSAPVRGHSEKPRSIHQLIERLHGDVKRIELFSRERRPGWDSFGNQVPSQVQGEMF